MKTLTKKWQIILYGCAGIGVNMLNIIVGSYLCSALLPGGFAEKDIGFWTYSDRNLVIAGIWATLILIAKVFDGLIDIPLSSFTDKLRTRWGRRRPAIVIGFIPMIAAYLLFLVPLNNGETVLNTIWFAVMLCLFYGAYTLTMIAYYATFAEIVETAKDRLFLSTVKSICDVVYFSVSFALVPVFVNVGRMNIRWVALLFLPLAATMMIPLFLIKEPSTKDGVPDDGNTAKGVGFIKSLTYSFRNKKFIYWLCCLAVMNFGLQLFLSGINEFFSSTGLNMTLIMASSFAPVPFTIQIYNKLVKKKGVKFGYQYCLLVYSFAMILLFVCRMLPLNIMTPVAILCGLIVSLAMGTFFSITYAIPAQLAAEENARTGICASSMYFAVQGLFEAVAAGLATGPMLVFLKQHNGISYMTLIIAIACMSAFVMAFFLPKSIALLGKESK
ncbi:MAG: MFS transporter [Clostridia bacterium]|nr:MFS transporter [Clostridia bacterium]